MMDFTVEKLGNLSCLETIIETVAGVSRPVCHPISYDIRTSSADLTLVMPSGTRSCGECSKIKKPLAGSKSIDPQDLDFGVVFALMVPDAMRPYPDPPLHLPSQTTSAPLSIAFENISAGRRRASSVENYGIHIMFLSLQNLICT